MNTQKTASLSGFPHKFEVSEDVEGDAQVGFIHAPSGTSINDVTESCCGRFPGTAVMYGLSTEQFDGFQALRQVVDSAVEAGVNALALQVQASLSVTSGDLAGVYFADEDANQSMRAIAVGYLVAELNAARSKS
jgi:hypothetical protein